MDSPEDFALEKRGHIPGWSWAIPVVIIIAAIGGLIWLYATDHFARQVATIIIPFTAFGAVFLWYLCTPTSRGRRKPIFWTTVGVCSTGIVLLFALFRRDHSASGSALPRFVWRWEADKDANLDSLSGLKGEKAAAPTREVIEGLIDSPYYLGPNRDGNFEGVILNPNWNSTPPKELWRRRVGLGWSGFAVVGGRAITQEQRSDKELVTCYDVLTGKPLWAHSDIARFEEEMGGHGPRATPSVKNDRVFALGATGILNCLDLKSGDVIWSKNILKDNGDQKNLRWGKSASPLLMDGLVVVSLGSGEDSPTLAAYRQTDGERIWAGGTDEASYATPVLATVAGVRQILSTNANSLSGHDPATGSELWSLKFPGRMPKVAIPLPVSENQILAPVGYTAPARSMLVKLTKDDAGKLTAKAEWRNIKFKTKFSNACIKGNYAYGLDEKRLTCIDWRTGKRVWREESYGYGQNIRAGDYLIVQAEEGHVAIVDASPDGYAERGRIKALNDQTWNTPTLAGKFLFVRNDTEAVCYELPTGKVVPDPPRSRTPWMTWAIVAAGIAVLFIIGSLLLSRSKRKNS